MLLDLWLTKGSRKTGFEHTGNSLKILNWLLSIASFLATFPINANGFLEKAQLKTQIVSSDNLSKYQVDAEYNKRIIDSYCSKLSHYFKTYGWEKKPCSGVDWKAKYKTLGGYPLLYASFGSGEYTTLILSGVHPDEYTPIPMGFRFARYLAKEGGKFKNSRIIIAPLVNPDGFIRQNPTRTNANGIDPNRNFFTEDWHPKAIAWWKGGKNRAKRHFPGYLPNSEIETLFQIELLDRFKPDKIISIHAPLGFLDYDGPGDRKPKNLSETERDAKNLAQTMAKKSSNYRLVDYSFYPGSLGNFAGAERHIPTITLELETTQPKLVNKYWKQFLPALIHSVEYPYKNKEESLKNKPIFSKLLSK